MTPLLILILAGSAISLIGIVTREKIGGTFPNALMRQHAHTPLIIGGLWIIRILGVLAILGLLFEIFFHEPIEKYTPPKEKIILIDISKSMESIEGDLSRLEKAKGLLTRSIRDTVDTHFGLIIFAGKVFALSAPTDDRDGIVHMIEALSTDTLNQYERDTSGTNIGDALIAGRGLFSSGSRDRSFLLVTDGRANIGLDPRIALELIKKESISISTLAIGASSGSTLTYRGSDGKVHDLLDASGNTITGDIDIPLLEELARETDGTYSHDTLPSGTSIGMGSPLLISRLDWERYLLFLIAFMGLSHLMLSVLVWKRHKS